ncbi:MAG TPA: CHASE2 domain-containing protein [Coleofasciculaceae cyanobacterium]
MSSPFYLEVDRTEHLCSFRLSWGRGQRRLAKLPFPETLISLYRNWKESYRQFYRSGLRVRVAESGEGVLPPVDWRTRLAQAEATLLAEFHYWLNDAALLPIRSEIAKAAANSRDSSDVDVFLTCNQMELTRLPWETWELRSEFATTKTIRIARTPANIREPANLQKHRNKLRILAILGDATGLNFESDRKAVKFLAPLATFKFVGWQPGTTRNQLMAEICQAIADAEGWDILFFAGHSNETELTGGDLGIAPHESILVQEIAPQLAIAQQQGLKFAIFNSCSGLSIADRLIDLGLSQVAIMREPIHNQVAQEFLLGFVQGLAAYRDVHDSLLLACQRLKLDKNLTYPSAYLIPSLFRHPAAPLFRPQPPSWWQWLRAWLPQSRPQAIGLASLLLLSLIPDVQNLLLESRLWLQANYRQLTKQLPAEAAAPVLLVQIDPVSIQQAGLDARKISPIDRRYLAKLLDRVQQLQPKVVGIDYVLDYPTPQEDQKFRRSLEQAVAQQTWLVFAVEEQQGRETRMTPTIARPNQVLQGYSNAFLGYVELPETGQSCYQKCPFAYLLAMALALNQPPLAPPQPPASLGQDFRTGVINYWQRAAPAGNLVDFLRSLRLSSLTVMAQAMGQAWLHPIQDFSIPPRLVYQQVSAHQLLEGSVSVDRGSRSASSPFPIVLIAPGGYTLNQAGEDNFPIPLAIAHWRQHQATAPPQSYFTGAEALSYMVHHFLNRRLVVPIPDFWMVALAAIAGRATVLLLKRQPKTKMGVGWFSIATGAYGLVCLQLLIAPGIVLPWLLPSLMFWVYVLPTMRRKENGSS